jgi:hypothetical protein
MPRICAVVLAFLFLVPHALAEEVVNPVTLDPDEAACRETLALTSEQVVIRSYRIRLDDCVAQRRAERDKAARLWRLTRRAEDARDRLTRNSKAFLLRRFGSLEEPSRQIEERKRMLEEHLKSHRALPTRSYSEKPSGRALKRALERSNREAREKQSQTFQERYRIATEACRPLTSHFHRQNCIRGKLRELGTKQVTP